MSMASGFQLIGGVALFIYGIKLMSDALQAIAGDRMRKLVGSFTGTACRGVMTGALVTVLLQSSSATTVMTVSFVNAGLMGLKQAIGVIMGANIGTTTSAQLIAFNIKEFILPLIAVGVALAIFGKKNKHRHFGNGLVGFGLLFLGMQTMEGAMYFLRDSGEFFSAFSVRPLWGVLAGAALTMVVQSSAATIGLTMAMAAQGLLTLDAAVPIILGDNIGTTITAVLSCIGTSRPAKQAAMSHVLFNVSGVIIFMTGLPLFKSVVLATSDNIARQLANAHTIFNVVNTIIFLPFTGVFARAIELVLPSLPEMKSDGALYLDEKLIGASPAAAVTATRDELLHMFDVLREMMSSVWNAYEHEGSGDMERFEAQESSIDEINFAVNEYAVKIWRCNLSQTLSSVLGSYVVISANLERVGDHLMNLLEIAGSKSERSVRFSDDAFAEFADLFRCAERAFDMVRGALINEDKAPARVMVNEIEPEIDMKQKLYRDNHIVRLNSGACDAERGVLFCDALSNLERVGDHCTNIAEAIIGDIKSAK